MFIAGCYQCPNLLRHRNQIVGTKKANRKATGRLMVWIDCSDRLRLLYTVSLCALYSALYLGVMSIAGPHQIAPGCFVAQIAGGDLAISTLLGVTLAGCHHSFSFIFANF